MSVDKNINLNIDHLKEQLKHDDWYIRLEDYLKTIVFPIVHGDINVKTRRHMFYDLVTQMLSENQIPLAKNGPNFDKDRKLINTIVIHHSDEDPNMKLSKLSAIGFVRQYGKDYLHEETCGYRIKGQPIWSGHFKDGEMVFFAYHFIVFENGRIERLLEDKYIGWQSGDWDINTRSIAIVLAGDYANKNPSEKQIKAIANIIKQNYSHVSLDRIFGHREINLQTICPGDKFIGGWKNTLLEAVRVKYS